MTRGERAVAPSDVPIRIGVNRCLLGEPVRCDGGHKRDTFLTDLLGRYLERVPICPEAEAGRGTPRYQSSLCRPFNLQLVAKTLAEQLRGWM